MPIPLTAVSICNLALDLLQNEPISSLSPPKTKEEKICARWYDHVRVGALRAHPWNFATKRAKIPKDTVDPVSQFSAAYQLPNELVRVLRVGENGLIKNYEIEGRLLLTSHNDISEPAGTNLAIKYTTDFTDVGKFDQLFVEAFSTKFAMKLAKKITGKSSLVAGLKIMFDDIIAEARSIDGQESPPKRVQISRFKRRRRAFLNRGESSGLVIFD